MADALVRPDAKSSGHLDTAVVTIRFDSGAIAVAEANFCATYGYDIRAEVFGSGGMLTMGDVKKSSLRVQHQVGESVDSGAWIPIFLRKPTLGKFNILSTRFWARNPLQVQAAKTHVLHWPSHWHVSSRSSAKCRFE